MDTLKDKTRSCLTDQKVLTVSSFVTLVSYVFQSIGLVSPAWISYDRNEIMSVSHYYGLWSECAYVTDGASFCETWESSDLSGSFKASQAFGILAFITLTCAVIGVIFYVFYNAKQFRKSIALSVFILFYTSGGLIFISVRLFAGANSGISGTTTSWAGIVCIIGGCMSVLLGVYFTLLFVMKPKEEPQTKEEEPEMPKEPLTEEEIKKANVDRMLNKYGKKSLKPQKNTKRQKS